MANRTANMQGWEGKPQRDGVSWQPNTVTRDRKQNNPSSFHHTKNNECSWSSPAAASGLSELKTEKKGAWWFQTAVWRNKFQLPGNLTYIKILMHGGTWAAGRVEKMCWNRNYFRKRFSSIFNCSELGFSTFCFSIFGRKGIIRCSFHVSLSLFLHVQGQENIL